MAPLKRGIKVRLRLVGQNLSLEMTPETSIAQHALRGGIFVRITSSANRITLLARPLSPL